VCNAGLQYSGDNTVRRTQDGFEVTVRVLGRKAAPLAYAQLTVRIVLIVRV
jgi:hypothetical protein